MMKLTHLNVIMMVETVVCYLKTHLDAQNVTAILEVSQQMIQLVSDNIMILEGIYRKNVKIDYISFTSFFTIK